MSMGELVQIVIAVVMLAGVIAAYLTALLNWRSSPVLLATKEKHSRDLMEVLDDWRQELVTRGLPGYYPPTVEQQPFSIEQHILFDDLKNHVPSELEIFKLWDRFKHMSAELDKKLVTYCDHIKGHLERHGGLNVLSREEESKETPLGITHHCLDWFYANLIIKAEGRPIRSLRLAIPDNAPNQLRGPESNIWAWTGSPAQARRLEDFLHGMLANINSEQSSAAEWTLFVEAKEVVSARNELEQLRDLILDRIAEVKAIPILTGDCKHIERARERLLPYRKPTGIRLGGLIVFIMGLVVTALAAIALASISLLVAGMIIMVAGFVAVWLAGRR